MKRMEIPRNTKVMAFKFQRNEDLKNPRRLVRKSVRNQKPPTEEKIQDLVASLLSV